MLTPEDKQQIEKIIADKLSGFIKVDRYVFDKNIQILDGRNIQLGRTTGTKIGTATDQKIGFYGKTPSSVAIGGYLNQVEASSFNTASTSFVDVTGLTITVTVVADTRVLLLFNGPVCNDTLGEYVCLTFTVDGSNIGGTDGLTFIRQPVAGYFQNASLVFVTVALSAGSHTFKVQVRTTVGTATINSGATRAIFSAIQV